MEYLQVFIIAFFCIVNLFYLFLLISSCVHYYKKRTRIDSQHAEFLLNSEGLPSISLLIPAYNEEEIILDTLKNMLNIPYRNKHVIVINDGSTDRTLHLLKSRYRLMHFHGSFTECISTKNVKGYYRSTTNPDLIVIDKENGGVGDALNAGLNACRTDYFIVVDADTVIDHQRFNVLLHHFFATGNVQAGEMVVGIANACKLSDEGVNRSCLPGEYLTAMQVIEYIRAFAIGRGGWFFLGGPALISGACSFYHVETVKSLGGFDPENMGQDFELSLRYKKEMIRAGKPFFTEFFEEPVGWTQAPSTYKGLASQRLRWHIGLIQTLWKHRDLFFNPRYHVLGCVIFPYFVFAELLTPIIEVLGYAYIGASLFFGVGHPGWVAFAIVFTWGFTMLLTLASISLDMARVNRYSVVTDLWKMIGLSILENVSFRQLTLWWQLKAFFRYFTGRLKVDKMKRKPIEM